MTPGTWEWYVHEAQKRERERNEQREKNDDGKRDQEAGR